MTANGDKVHFYYGREEEHFFMGTTASYKGIDGTGRHGRHVIRGLMLHL